MRIFVVFATFFDQFALYFCRRCFKYLRTTLGVDSVKCVVMTHPHDDHIGGVPAVLNSCTVENLLSPVKEYHGDRFDTVVNTAEKQGLPITVPSYEDEFFVGGARCRIVSPIQTSSVVNNISLVILVEYGDTRFLLTGDTEKDAEEFLLNSDMARSTLAQKLALFILNQSDTPPQL